MKRPRGFGLVELVIYAALAAALAGAVYWATTALVAWIDHFGAEKQKAIDAPIIAKANAERDAAISDRDIARNNEASCKTAVGVAEEQAKKDKEHAAALEGELARARRDNAKAATAVQPKIDALREEARAKGAEKLACDAELEVTSKELREQAKERLRERRGR